MDSDERTAPAQDGWFRQRFEQSPLPQTSYGLDGVLNDVNEAFCRLVNRTPDELVGLPAGALTHRSDSGEADARLGPLLRGASAQIRVERILSGPHGRPVPTLLDASLLRDEHGHPVG